MAFYRHGAVAVRVQMKGAAMRWSGVWETWWVRKFGKAGVERGGGDVSVGLVDVERVFGKDCTSEVDEWTQEESR